MLVNEISQLKQECKKQQREIERKSMLFRNDTDPQLVSAERAIAVLTNEKHLLSQKTQDLIMREEDAQNTLSYERKRIQSIHLATTRLLCSKDLFQTLKKLVAKQYQKSFQQLWMVNNYQQNQTNLLFLLQKIINRIGFKFKKNVLLTWYTQALLPKQTKQLSQKLPGFYKKKCLRRLEQNKFQLEKFEDNIDDQRLLRVARIVAHVTNQFETRLKHSSLAFWHRRVHNQLYILKLLNRRYSRHYLFNKKIGFDRWCNFVFQENQMTRFNALPVMLTECQVKMRLIQVWRHFSLNKALRKRGRLVRAFKNLKVTWQNRKMLDQLSLLVSRVQKQSQDSIKQACWSQIQIQNEQEMHNKAKEQVAWIEPIIFSTKRENSQLKQIKDKNQLQRAVYALVITPFSRHLTQIMQTWRAKTFNKTYMLNNDIKMLVNKLHLSKLRLAFDRMKICEADLQLKKHHTTIDGIHAEIVSCQTDNYLLGAKIYAEDIRVKHLAFKHLRGLCQSAFDANLTYWLQKWQIGCTTKRIRIQACAFFIQKIRKCILFQSLARYRRGFLMLNQDDYNSNRVKEVASRLAVRQKKRVFNAINFFASIHTTRVKSLKFLFQTIQHHNMIRGIIAWKNYTRQNRESNLLLTEKIHVDKIEMFTQESGNIQEVFSTKDKQIKHLQAVHKLQASLTAIKWIERSCMGGLQFGFITWRQKSSDLKHRTLFLQSVRRHQVLKYLRNAWFRWLQTSQYLSLGTNEEYRNRVVQLTKTEQVKQAFARKNHKNRLKKLYAELHPYQPEMLEFAQKQAKLFELMCKIKDQHDFMFQTRFILRKWYQHSKRYRFIGKALEKGITNLMQQRGFNEIRNFVRAKVLRKKQLQALIRQVKLHRMFGLRLFYNRWRDYNHKIELHDKFTIMRIRNSAIVKQISFCQRTFQHNFTMINQRKYNQTLRAMYDCWHQYAYSKAIKRRSSKELQHFIDNMKKRKWLLKFAANTQQQFKKRILLEKQKLKYKKIYQEACFTQIKNEYRKNKRMIYSTISLKKTLTNFQFRVCFEKIKSHSQIKFLASIRYKQQSSRWLCKIIDRIRTKHLRLGLSKVQQHSHQGRTLQAILQQYVILGKVQKVRNHFNRWKFNSELKEIYDENETGDGPVNLQSWNLRLQCNLFAKMMQQDGASDKQIQDVLNLQRLKFNQLGDKTITRLMIHSDENLRLLPIVLNKLRSHARAMKQWRRVLNYCNRICCPAGNQVYRMFIHWKEEGNREKTILKQIQYSELLKVSSQNQSKLVRLANNVDEHVDGLQKFKSQREILLKSYVSSQKLALQLTKQNFERSGHKALIKLSDYGNKNLQAQISLSINKNLQLIHELKSRINDLEDENSEISQRSDTYRIEALNAARGQRIIQVLRFEQAELITKQNQNAGLMKKLLEENYLLNKNIQTARVAAQNKLDHTQMLHHQKLIELEQLKQAERANAAKKASLLQSQIAYQSQQSSLSNHFQQQEYRETNERSLSPPAIVTSPTSRLRSQSKTLGNGKSPLRMRYSISNQHQV